MGKHTPEQLRDAQRRLEILDEFDLAQAYAYDHMPMVPMYEDQIAGCKDYGLVEYAEYLKAKDAKRKRAVKATVVKLCPWCGKKFKAKVGENGRPRKWHSEACRIALWRSAFKQMKADSFVTETAPSGS